jgi:hypothetical protein
MANEPRQHPPVGRITQLSDKPSVSKIKEIFTYESLLAERDALRAMLHIDNLPHAGCNYLGHNGKICNKCGQMVRLEDIPCLVMDLQAQIDLRAWQPIRTARKVKDPCIDLWVIDKLLFPNGLENGFRLPHCSWSHYHKAWVGYDGTRVEDEAFKITHWMFEPPKPKE